MTNKRIIEAELEVINDEYIIYFTFIDGIKSINLHSDDVGQLNILFNQLLRCMVVDDIEIKLSMGESIGENNETLQVLVAKTYIEKLNSEIKQLQNNSNLQYVRKIEVENNNV